MSLRSIISSLEKTTEPVSPQIHFVTEHVDKITSKFPLWRWGKLTVFYMTKTHCVCKFHMQNITHWWDKNYALSYRINRLSRRLVTLYHTFKVSISTFRLQNYIYLTFFFSCVQFWETNRSTTDLCTCAKFWLVCEKSLSGIIKSLKVLCFNWLQVLSYCLTNQKDPHLLPWQQH